MTMKQRAFLETLRRALLMIVKGIETLLEE
jgi:hypothetical protein